MVTFQPDARRVTVRCAYSEESIWRDALGDSEPLLVFVTYGALDAPDALPAGGMRASSHGPIAEISMRPGWH